MRDGHTQGVSTKPVFWTWVLPSVRLGVLRPRLWPLWLSPRDWISDGSRGDEFWLHKYFVLHFVHFCTMIRKNTRICQKQTIRGDVMGLSEAGQLGSKLGRFSNRIPETAPTVWLTGQNCLVALNCSVTRPTLIACGVQPSHRNPAFNPFTPRVMNLKFPLQPHQKYYITQYGELGFSSLTQMKDDYTTNLTYTYLFEKVGRMYSFNLRVKRSIHFHKFTVIISQIKTSQGIPEVPGRGHEVGRREGVLSWAKANAARCFY